MFKQHARRLESASMAAMMLGIVALCQPWILLLHQYSVAIIIAGLVAFRLLAHQDAERRRARAIEQPCRALGSADMADIEVIDAEKWFGDNYIIRKLNLQISTASSWCCSVPRAAARPRPCAPSPGSRDIDTGDILIDGKPVQTTAGRSDRDIAFVFQLFALYPHLTAYENIAFPLRAIQRSRSETVDSSVREVAQGAAASSTCSRKRPVARCPAATCSAWRSAARWCAGPRRC